jgi:hypothetical protein
MKHLFSILFSLLVFLSGMHISLATHYCQGKIAATKFSISGEKASCGMEKCKTNFPVTGNQIASNCCRDEIAVYATDNNYTPEVTQITKTAENIAQIFQIPSKHIPSNYYSCSILQQRILGCTKTTDYAGIKIAGLLHLHHAP